MQSSHTFTVDSAVFDERNLVSAAGLVPVLELAEQTGLSELIAEHVQLPSTRVPSRTLEQIPCMGYSVHYTRCVQPSGASQRHRHIAVFQPRRAGKDPENKSYAWL